MPPRFGRMLRIGRSRGAGRHPAADDRGRSVHGSLALRGSSRVRAPERAGGRMRLLSVVVFAIVAVIIADLAIDRIGRRAADVVTSTRTWIETAEVDDQGALAASLFHGAQQWGLIRFDVETHRIVVSREPSSRPLRLPDRVHPGQPLHEDETGEATRAAFWSDCDLELRTRAVIDDFNASQSSTTSPAGIAAEMLNFPCMPMILLRIPPQASTKRHQD
ncbi:MAG: hypothetical protein ACFE0R_14110 [Salinarimonas sp.]